MDYSTRTALLSPTVLPEHLRAIRETVLGSYIGYGEHSAPNANDYAEIIMLVARADLDKNDRDKILQHLESSHHNLQHKHESLVKLIDGIISWTGWAANWTRRNKNDETKAPPQEVKA